MKYEDELKQIIERMMKKPRERDQAFRRLRSKLGESARHYDRLADNKAKLYADQVNEVIAREIEFLRTSANLDWDRIKELDEIFHTDWAK